MINIIIEPALLLGAVFALVMLFLYGLRFVNPDLATDWDIFITTLGIVYSSIILVVYVVQYHNNALHGLI